MKIWKIFKAGNNIISYVNVNEKDSRDTMYSALQLARKYFNDFSISGIQLYYLERFVFDGIEYFLDSLNCALWTDEAYGFCRRADGSQGLYTVDFNNKQELLPISVGLPL